MAYVLGWLPSERNRTSLSPMDALNDRIPDNFLKMCRLRETNGHLVWETEDYATQMYEIRSFDAMARIARDDEGPKSSTRILAHTSFQVRAVNFVPLRHWRRRSLHAFVESTLVIVVLRRSLFHYALVRRAKPLRQSEYPAFLAPRFEKETPL